MFRGSVFEHNLVDETNTIEVPLKSFADIVSEYNHKHIDILKMDIEGSEYLVIDQILNSGVHIKQLLVETHERFFPNGKTKGDEFFKKIYQKGFRIFGISDTYQEISFVKTT